MLSNRMTNRKRTRSHEDWIGLESLRFCLDRQWNRKRFNYYPLEIANPWIILHGKKLLGLIYKRKWDWGIKSNINNLPTSWIVGQLPVLENDLARQGQGAKKAINYQTSLDNRIELKYREIDFKENLLPYKT